MTHTPSSKTIHVLVAILIALVIFWAGIAVGYSKATFSYRWHSSYAEQFAGDRSPLLIPNDGDSDNMPNSHGAFGTVVSIHLPLIIIKGPIEAEKTITVTNDTLIRNIHDQTASTSISVGQNVVVMGEPDDQGRIVASFIRILPEVKIEQTLPATSSPTIR